MQYVTLGKTGLKISRVGFGGIPIQRIDAEKAKPLIDALIECGINYIDTARGYTVSEEYIGGAIDGRRDKFVLATKSMARTREAMEADIETSLRNLRTDYIDLYQVHNPSMEHRNRCRRRTGGTFCGTRCGQNRAYRHHRTLSDGF